MSSNVQGLDEAVEIWTRLTYGNVRICVQVNTQSHLRFLGNMSDVIKYYSDPIVSVKFWDRGEYVGGFRVIPARSVLQALREVEFAVLLKKAESLVS